MEKKLKLLWIGVEHQIYSAKTTTRIKSARVSCVDYISTTIKGWKWRKISPKFGEQFERLLQGRLKSFTSTWLHSLIGTDVKALATSLRSAVASKAIRVSPYVQRVVSTLSEEEWAKLRAKASYIAQSVKDGRRYVSTRKGISPRSLRNSPDLPPVYDD